jgi:hypothetical protein
MVRKKAILDELEARAKRTATGEKRTGKKTAVGTVISTNIKPRRIKI